MYTIDVDFDVYKQLTVLRTTEDVTYNDVIRGLLGITKPETDSAKTLNGLSSGDWLVKNVKFPVGTEFRANYKGKTYTARVDAGSLVLSTGEIFNSPSSAASSITKTGVNGWNFWECKLPGNSTWQMMKFFRKK